MKLSRRLLAFAFGASLIPAAALATDGSITIKDAAGVNRSYVVVLDGLGNFVGKAVICDYAAAANCAGVDAAHNLQVIAGAGSTTVVTQPTAANLNARVVDATGAALATAASQTSVQGSKGAGVAAANSELAGGVYNTTLPTLTNTQQAGLQLDSSGRVIVNVGAGGGSGGTSSTFGAAFPGTGTAIGFSNGTNLVAGTIKAASTAAAASDPAIVVAISPNGVNANGQATMANSAPVVIASNQAAFSINAQPTPVTTGGLTNYFVQPAASDNHVVIKAGAGQVYYISFTNNSATVNYVRLYNATTGFNGCNSATNHVGQWIVPASTSGAGITHDFSQGIAFATGIAICVTAGYALTDTTNATAAAMAINVGFK